MTILALDASTEVLSLACRTEAGLYEVCRDLELRHSEVLLPMIAHLLAEVGKKPQDVNLVVTARGPGSFTGLRIGFATMKGFAAGTGAGFISVPTFDAYGRDQSCYPGVVAPLLDARKKRWYTALYLRGRRITDYLDLPLEAFLALTEQYPQVLLTGVHASQALQGIRGLLAAKEGGSGGGPGEARYLLDPRSRAGRAVSLLELGAEAAERGELEGEDSGPLYLRPSEAEIHRGG